MVEDAAKICTICGEDCAARPRVKDVEGNYFCKPCLNDRQRGGGGPAPASGASPFLDASPTAAQALWADVDQPGRPSVGRDGTRYIPCMQCGTRMKEDAVLCTACGYNPRRGKRLTTRITKENEPAESAAFGETKAGSGRAQHMALAAVGGLIGGAVAGVPWIGVAFIGYYILWLGLLIGAGAGVGAAKGAGEHRGLTSGLIGACMAAVTFMGVQYVAFAIHVEAARAVMLHQVNVTDDDVKFTVYEEVFDELEREGKASRADQYDQTEYPKVVSREGDRRYDKMTDSARNSRRSDLLNQRKHSINVEFDALRTHFMMTDDVNFNGNKWLVATGPFLWICFGGAVIAGFASGTSGKFRV